MAQLILHICAIGFTAEKFLIAQAEHQRQKGYRVGFIFSPSPETSRLKEMGFEVYELSVPREMNPLQDLKAIWQMQALFKQLNPILIHTHTSKGGLVGRCAAWFAGVPCIVHTIHGFPFSEGMQAFKYWTFVFVERSLALLTHSMFSQSAEDVVLGTQYKILPRDRKIQHIGNGVDLSRFAGKNQSLDIPILYLELGLPKDAVIILTIGRINHEKGYYELLDALPSLPDYVHLICVGFDEGHQQVLKDKIISYGLQQRVHWLGLRHDILAIMASSDYFVLASHREGVPRSLIEAQAMGLPCVATNIRGCREVIIHNETGLLVQPKNVYDLQLALKELLSNSARAKQLAIAGQKRVREHFNEKIVCEKIWQGYEALLSIKRERKE
jgi:glycosyltransferase involved in cell wall biosynthesis